MAGLSVSESPSIFCHRCLTNQQIQIELLSAFEGSNVPAPSSSYASSSSTSSPSPYQAYKADLDARYPVLCERCRPGVESKIKERDDVARRWIWRRWMERDREPVQAGMGQSHPGFRATGRHHKKRRRRQAMEIAKIVISISRWLLIIAGPLSTISHLLTIKLHLWMISPFSTLIPVHWTPWTWETITLLSALVTALSYIEYTYGPTDDETRGELDEDTHNGVYPPNFLTLGLLHILSSLQLIPKETFLVSAPPRIHTMLANLDLYPLTQSLPSANAVELSLCTLQVVVFLTHIVAASSAAQSRHSNNTSRSEKREVETQDVFDSLAHSLNHVTDTIFTTSSALTDQGAIFGQTAWGSSLPPPRARGEEDVLPLSLSSSSGVGLDEEKEDRMEIDGAFAMGQEENSMDWQPTPPPPPPPLRPGVQVDETTLDPRQNSASPSFRPSFFGQQRFYYPEEPIGGLEESFSKSLSLEDSLRRRETGEAEQSGWRKVLGQPYGLGLIFLLTVVVGVLTSVMFKDQVREGEWSLRSVRDLVKELIGEL